MSKLNKIITLKRELKDINKKIDLRIMMRIPYRREAKYHRRLVTELRRLTQNSWFARLAF